MAADDEVVVGQTHGSDDPESVLIGYLLGVEALRAGKEVVLWLTKDGVHTATEGYRGGLSVPGAPSIGDLRAEYMDKGGPFLAGPVCVKSRRLEQAVWVTGAEVKGPPSLTSSRSAGRPHATTSDLPRHSKPNERQVASQSEKNQGAHPQEGTCC
jgi:predicted peroxiredoxin